MEDKLSNIKEAFLPKYLPSTKDISNIDARYLTSAGDNYGSLMLAVDITLKDKITSEESTLNAVVKTPPENELIRTFFQSTITMEKELRFYSTIVPTLQQFQKEQGIEILINFIPEYYGGRFSTNPNTGQVDSDTVVIMENLKCKGFSTEDRIRGFGLDGAKSVLKDLSILHGVVLALRKLKPKTFEENVLPYLKYTGIVESYSAHVVEQGYIKHFLKALEENSDCQPYLVKFKNHMEIGSQKKYNDIIPSEKWGTLTHNDLWVNNVMVKFEDGEIVAKKLVDFQVTEYNSPAKDVLFFIFDSTSSTVVIDHYEDLLQHYHFHFIDTLKQLKVDSEPYSYEEFLKEIESAVKQTSVLLQCILMISPIFQGEEKVKEVEHINEDDLKNVSDLNIKQKQRLWLLVQEFGRRNWL